MKKWMLVSEIVNNTKTHYVSGVDGKEVKVTFNDFKCNKNGSKSHGGKRTPKYGVDSCAFLTCKIQVRLNSKGGNKSTIHYLHTNIKENKC